MDFGPAVNTFVPLWIFAPLVPIGVIERLRTRGPSTSRREAQSGGPAPTYAPA